MKKSYDEFSRDRSSLQSKLNTLLNSISDRSVSLSGEAHSGNICTVLITCSGIRGTMSKTMVMISEKRELKEDNLYHKVWVTYVNGYKYELSSVTELKSAITQQISLMKPLVQYR